jgi:hypothetical protein
VRELDAKKATQTAQNFFLVGCYSTLWQPFPASSAGRESAPARSHHEAVTLQHGEVADALSGNRKMVSLSEGRRKKRAGQGNNGAGMELRQAWQRIPREESR